jgi:hypothetical protein
MFPRQPHLENTCAVFLNDDVKQEQNTNGCWCNRWKAGEIDALRIWALK